MATYIIRALNRRRFGTAARDPSVKSIVCLLPSELRPGRVTIHVKNETRRVQRGSVQGRVRMQTQEAKIEDDDEGPPPGWQPINPPTLTPTPTPTPRPRPSEMAQMVCGSCRRLLSYLRGAKHVKCSCCQTVNLVLEAHQVGQVKCGNCAVLLMYPYGASQVRCSSCQCVTEIGAHNKRPPWSVQQGKPTPHKTVC